MVNQVTPYGTLTYRRANTLDAPPPATGGSGGSAATGGAGQGKNLYDNQGRMIFDSFGNYYGNDSMFQTTDPDAGTQWTMPVLRDADKNAYFYQPNPGSPQYRSLTAANGAPELAPINQWGNNGFTSSVPGTGLSRPSGGSGGGGFGGGGGGYNGNLRLGDGIYYNDVPQYEAVTQLSPEEQRIFDVDQANRLLLNQTGNEQLTKVRSILNKPFDPGLPDFTPYSQQQLLDQIGGRTNDLSREFLDPIYQQREDQLRARLANQGIVQGSNIYSNELRDFGDERSRAYISASLPYRQQALAEVLNANSQELRNRQQAYQESLATRNQPLNEIAALLSQSQVQMPEWVSTPTVAMQSPDMMGLVQSNYQAQVQQANARNAQTSQILGGLFGLGAGFLRSDRRAKTNVRKVGKLDNGLDVYAYRYIEGGPTMIGVMAQDVEQVNPAAVVELNGVKYVDYDAAVEVAR